MLASIYKNKNKRKKMHKNLKIDVSILKCVYVFMHLVYNRGETESVFVFAGR